LKLSEADHKSAKTKRQSSLLFGFIFLINQ